MTFKLFYLLPLAATAMAVGMPSTAQAQIDAAVMKHAQAVAKTCPGAWDKPACLKVLGESNFDMTVDYAAKLEAAGKKDFLEPLKQSCAASTAAREQDVPAYAMTSASKECANSIYDITQKTKVSPDRNYYQLIVASTLCLEGAKECADLEKQMHAIAQQ